MLWAEAKQMAALDTYAAEQKLSFPLLDKCEEKACVLSLSYLGAATVGSGGFLYLGRGAVSFCFFGKQF